MDDLRLVAEQPLRLGDVGVGDQRLAGRAGVSMIWAFRCEELFEGLDEARFSTGLPQPRLMISNFIGLSSAARKPATMSSM